MITWNLDKIFVVVLIFKNTLIFFQTIPLCKKFNSLQANIYFNWKVIKKGEKIETKETDLRKRVYTFFIFTSRDDLSKHCKPF